MKLLLNELAIKCKINPRSWHKIGFVEEWSKSSRPKAKDYPGDTSIYKMKFESHATVGFFRVKIGLLFKLFLEVFPDTDDFMTQVVKVTGTNEAKKNFEKLLNCFDVIHGKCGSILHLNEYQIYKIVRDIMENRPFDVTVIDKIEITDNEINDIDGKIYSAYKSQLDGSLVKTKLFYGGGQDESCMVRVFFPYLASGTHSDNFKLTFIPKQIVLGSDFNTISIKNILDHLHGENVDWSFFPDVDSIENQLLSFWYFGMKAPSELISIARREIPDFNEALKKIREQAEAIEKPIFFKN